MSLGSPALRYCLLSWSNSFLLLDWPVLHEYGRRQTEPSLTEHATVCYTNITLSVIHSTSRSIPSRQNSYILSRSSIGSQLLYVQVVYVEEDEVEAEDPFAPGAEDNGSQGSAEEESGAEDEELQDVDHLYDDDSDCE